jgi:hypothetical protein
VTFGPFWAVAVNSATPTTTEVPTTAAFPKVIVLLAETSATASQLLLLSSIVHGQNCWFAGWMAAGSPVRVNVFALLVPCVPAMLMVTIFPCRRQSAVHVGAGVTPVSVAVNEPAYVVI